MANKHLKKWAGIPTRGATNLSIFHPQLMGIKSPSQTYFEGHAGNYLLCRLKADTNVQLALDSQLSREANWTRKSSTISQCSEIIEQVSENYIFPTQENCVNFQASVNHQTPILKKAVKDAVAQRFKEKYNKQAQNLEIQGEFLQLLTE